LEGLKQDLVRQEAETEFLKEKMKIFGSAHSESPKKEELVDSNPPTSDSEPEDLSDSDLTDTALMGSLGEHQELHEFVRLAKIEVTASKEKFGIFVSTVEAFGEQNLTKIDRNLMICDGFLATVEKLLGALDSEENFMDSIGGEGLLELRKVNKKLRSRLEIIFGLKGCLDDGLSAWELARDNRSNRGDAHSENSEKSSGKGDVDIGNSARDTEPKFGQTINWKHYPGDPQPALDQETGSEVADLENLDTKRRIYGSDSQKIAKRSLEELYAPDADDNDEISPEKLVQVLLWLLGV
jgi:hypothetical protein